MNQSSVETNNRHPKKGDTNIAMEANVMGKQNTKSEISEGNVVFLCNEKGKLLASMVSQIQKVVNTKVAEVTEFVQQRT